MEASANERRVFLRAAALAGSGMIIARGAEAAAQAKPQSDPNAEMMEDTAYCAARCWCTGTASTV